MRYEWDSIKRASTLQERGIDFVDAVRIFSGPTLEWSRWPQSYAERRIVALGMVEGVELVVVYAQLTLTRRRVISARRAKRKERRLYAQAYPRR
ncbi:MAG: BrnT family toxin [Gemmatimonadales bacterium]|nr:BrnT family toxin [Gemmatimonadales bacterium]MBA3554155.1 BrnT family toxin [Gemmatimonadales bacterium]